MPDLPGMSDAPLTAPRPSRISFAANVGGGSPGASSDPTKALRRKSTWGTSGRFDSFMGRSWSDEPSSLQRERGDVALEDSIKLYERGAELKKRCEAKLKDAEEKVAAITLDRDGQPTGTTPVEGL